MRIAVNKIILLLAVLAFAPGSVLAAGQRSLLARASDGTYWIAQVAANPDVTPAAEETHLFTRTIMGEPGWVPMPDVAGRAVCLANSGGELAVVLDDGQWTLASPGSTRNGPLDTNLRIVAIANDERNLWMIARPSSGSTTQASSAPAGAEAAAPPTTAATATTAPAPPARLVLYRFVSDRWAEPHELPAGISDQPANLSMAVIEGQPVLAYRAAADTVKVIRCREDRSWEEVGQSPATPIADFKLLAPLQTPMLWISGSVAGGRIYIGPTFDRAIDLTITGNAPPLSAETVTYAGERLRYLRVDDRGKIWEQPYDLQGTPVGAIAQLAQAPPLPGPVSYWLEGVVVMSVAVFALGLARRRSITATPATTPREGQLNLAPLGPRLAAGAIDALPVLVAVALLIRHGVGAGQPVETRWWIILAVAVGIYLAHTLVLELLKGASVGKMFFGLHVVTPRGNPPRPMAIVIRNLLRIADCLVIPLMLVMTSPLHQRLGDLAAGTVVISEYEPEVEDNEDA